MTRSISVLMGSEIVYVTGTVNGAVATWTLSAPNQWSTAVERSADDQYKIEISAYDAAGNHTEQSVTLTYGLRMRWDWTVEDYLNADDLNRIEGNVTALRDLLLMHGYVVAVAPRQEVPEETIVHYVWNYIEDEDGSIVDCYTTGEIDHVETIKAHSDWIRTDFPIRSEIDRIRRNIDALQMGFCSLPDWREIVYNNTVDAEQINAAEWDLHAISMWLERMAAAFVYSGELYGGEL